MAVEEDEFAEDADQASAPEYSAPVSRGSTLDSFTRGNGLRPAEIKLREAVMRGETCTIGDGTRPEYATRENTIRASFLRYLILGGCEQTPIHQRGVNLVGAYIACRETQEFGKCLDLQAASIEVDLRLMNSIIEGSVILYGARTRTLIFDGSKVHGFFADRLVCEGSLYLRNQFKATKLVRLLGARISGSFGCDNSSLLEKNLSLICDGMETIGSVFLSNGFEASGQVRLVGAKVLGSLDCNNCKIGNETTSLHCDGMEIKGDVFLNNGFSASGNVRLLGAIVGGDLALRGGAFWRDINAHNTTINGNIYLDDGFQIQGTVNLPNATIGGNVYCDGGTFHNKDQAIQANKAVIEGNVILGAINSAGKIAFQSAHIKGDFSANGATLSGKPCLELRNAKIDGTFHWRDVAHALGRLDLGGASAKTLNMDAKSWEKPETIKLNNFSYLGFENLEPGANTNYWKDYLLKQPEKDLTEKFRPKPWEHLAGVLDTMGYEEEARSIRIERQKLRTRFMAYYDPDRFEAGNGGNSNRRMLHAMTVFWRKVFSGPLVDYGYRPGKAIIYLLLLIMVGTGVYWKAAFNGIMTPTHPLIFKEAIAKADGSKPLINPLCAENWVFFPKEIETECADAMPSEYSEFQSLIYAADIALPIVDLRMESDWAPRVVNTDGSRNWWGYGVRIFEWFLIISGWVLSLLFASAVGGIIRR